VQTEQIFKEKYDGDFEGKKALALEHALDIRKFEIELYWKRATYFWTFIGASLAGFVAVQSLDGENQKNLSVILSCLGAVFSYAWILVNRGSKFWQENWEKHVDLLEDSEIGPLYKTVLHRNEPQGFKENALHYATGSSYISVSKINHIVSLYMFLLWFILTIYSLLPISLSLPINWLYAALIALTVICCASFHFLCKTYSGGYAPIVMQRTTNLKSATTAKASTD
jgi:hypothetical protein